MLNAECRWRIRDDLDTYTRFTIILAIFLSAGCGKVGDPLPPFIRIPEPIKDLAVTQSGNMLVLTWTNPTSNIDGSSDMDLARIQIRSNGSVVAATNVTGPGQPQTHPLPVGTSVGAQRSFTAVAETARNKVSDVSNTASITPIEVPGPVTRLRATVDQRRVLLQWERPQERPELADAYLVVRTDIPEERHVVSETRYTDSEFEQGKKFTYEVTPLRQSVAGAVSGVGPESHEVILEDKTPPKTPAGLDPVRSETGVFLTWNANEETDLAGYRVYKSDRADGGFMRVERLITNNSFFDPASESRLYYAVSAVDDFANESFRSAPVRVP